MPIHQHSRSLLCPSLLALVVVVFGGVAIVWASEWWRAAALTATGCTLVAAILLAAYREGARRVFWSGFVLSAGAYALASIYCGLGSSLPTGKTLDVGILLLESTHDGPTEPRSYVIQRPVEEFSGGRITTRTVYETVEVQYPVRPWRTTIGHCLWSLLLGIVGGGLAAWVLTTRGQPPTSVRASSA